MLTVLTAFALAVGGMAQASTMADDTYNSAATERDAAETRLYAADNEGG